MKDKVNISLIHHIYVLLKADCSVVEIVMSVEIIFWKSYASNKYPM